MGNVPSQIKRKVSTHRFESHETDDHESPSRKQVRKNQTAALLTLFEKLELTADGANTHPGELSKATFENAFHGPYDKFGKLMYHQMVSANNTSTRERITREEFVKAGKEILKLQDEKNVIRFYFHLFASGKEHLSIEDARNMFEISFSLTLSLSQILYREDARDPQVIEAMTTGLFGISKEISVEEFSRWMNSSCPQLFSPVHNWVLHVMTGSSLPSELEMARVPTLDGIQTMSLAILWILSLTLPTVYTKHQEVEPTTSEEEQPSSTKDPMLTSMLLLRKLAKLPHCQNWQVLYNSDSHGMSINRFNNHVASYNAPNVMFLSFEGRNLYCLALDRGWKEGRDKFGGEDCRLIQLLPVYRVVQAGTNMVRWNEKTRDSPKGISIGCDGKTEVIRIPTDFDKIQHYKVDCSLHKVEVWGCGTDAALLSQQNQKQWEKLQVQKEQGRKLKLHGEAWDDTPDKQLLQWGGVNVGNHSYSQ